MMIPMRGDLALLLFSDDGYFVVVLFDRLRGKLS